MNDLFSLSVMAINLNCTMCNSSWHIGMETVICDLTGQKLIHGQSKYLEVSIDMQSIYFELHPSSGIAKKVLQQSTVDTPKCVVSR